MTARFAFAPLLPWPLVAALALLALLVAFFYWRRGGPARLFRMAGSLVLLLAIFNPSVVSEERSPLPDVATILIDRSDSMRLGKRTETADRIARTIAARLKDDPTLEVRIREASQSADGTALFAPLAEAVSDTPRDRLAGTILITDGQVQDVPADLKTLRTFGPISSVIVGEPRAKDRRLKLVAAPRFTIVGERGEIEIEVLDSEGGQRDASVSVRVDGGAARDYSVTTGRVEKLPFLLDRRGPHLVEISTPELDGELTALNNRIYAPVSAMRDRLRVLLITGEPHAGARVWRDLLKSDPAVDLVQFTILRPPDKQDGTPTEELALIAFPVRELFQEKLRSFDLVIFDRYRDRAVLPSYYFENIANYVEGGGALLIASGPPDAGPESLYRTPLAAILPARPTGSIANSPFRPGVTDLGRRHPVTATLAPDSERWGRWRRALGAQATRGETVLQGPGGPLLVLGRVGQGRTAQLFSDQIWLWARGYDGGGPHGELLRRLAHWLMKEPELEEERLTASVTDGALSIERRTLGATADPADITSPSGAHSQAPLSETTPGLFAAKANAAEIGLYTIRQGNLSALAASGPLNPVEWADVRATNEILKPVANQTRGNVVMAGEGDGADIPNIRRVGKGERAGGNDIPLVENRAYAVASAKTIPLLPAWASALLILALTIMAWRREAK